MNFNLNNRNPKQKIWMIWPEIVILKFQRKLIQNFLGNNLMSRLIILL